jgi:Flp pilus assembly protein TadG
MDRLPAISLRRSRIRAERGAALIHVGLAIFVLVAMSAFVLDFGVMWLSRRQAQNAADAGALAGAIARAWDEPVDTPAANGRAFQSAFAAATANRVFSEAGGVKVTWVCPDYVPATAHCVRVDVHRDGLNVDGVAGADSNELPVFFANLFGFTGQSVKATATAWVGAANAAECMKPFAVPDLFPDGNPAGYVRPGYTLDEHEGTILMLKGGAGTQLSPGWFRLLDLTGGEQGGAGGVEGTKNQIRACIPEIHNAGEEMPAQNGNEASIRQAIEDLYLLDPDAYWNPTTKRVEDSCAESGTCMKYVWGSNGNQTVADPRRTYSPRVMALPLFDPYIYATTGRIEIVNILGFFLLNDVDHPLPSPPEFRIWGVLISQPGLLISGGEAVPAEAAFAKVVQLIR